MAMAPHVRQRAEHIFAMPNLPAELQEALSNSDDLTVLELGLKLAEGCRAHDSGIAGWSGPTSWHCDQPQVRVDLHFFQCRAGGGTPVWSPRMGEATHPGLGQH